MIFDAGQYLQERRDLGYNNQEIVNECIAFLLIDGAHDIADPRLRAQLLDVPRRMTMNYVTVYVTNDQLPVLEAALAPHDLKLYRVPPHEEHEDSHYFAVLPVSDEATRTAP